MTLIFSRPSLGTGAVLAANLLILLAVSWSGFITSILEPNGILRLTANAVGSTSSPAVLPDLLWASSTACVHDAVPNNQALLLAVDCSLSFNSSSNTLTPAPSSSNDDCNSTAFFLVYSSMTTATAPLPSDLTPIARAGSTHVISLSASTPAIFVFAVDVSSAVRAVIDISRLGQCQPSDASLSTQVQLDAGADAAQLPVAAVVITVLVAFASIVGVMLIVAHYRTPSEESDGAAGVRDVTRSVDNTEDQSKPRTNKVKPPRQQREAREESEFSFDRPSVANADDVYMTCEMVEYEDASVIGVRIAEPIHALTGKDNERAVRFIDGLMALLIESRRTDNVVCAVTPFFHFGAAYYGRNHAQTATLAALRLRGFVDAGKENSFKTTITVESGKVISCTSGHFVQEIAVMGGVVDECERIARLHPILTANKGLLTGNAVAQRCDTLPSSRVAFLAVDYVTERVAPGAQSSDGVLGVSSNGASSLLTATIPGESTLTVPMLASVATPQLPGAIGDTSSDGVNTAVVPMTPSAIRGNSSWLFSPCPCTESPTIFAALRTATIQLLEALAMWNAAAALQCAANIEEAMGALDDRSPVDAMGVDLFSLRRLILAAHALEDASRTTLLGETNGRSNVDHLPRVYVGWQTIGKEPKVHREWAKALAGQSMGSLHKSATSTNMTTSRSDTATLAASAFRDLDFTAATNAAALSQRNDADWLEAELEALIKKKQAKLDAIVAKRAPEEPKPLPGLFGMLDDDDEADAVQEDQPAAPAAAGADANDDDDDEGGGGFCLFSFVPVAEKAPEDIVDEEDANAGEPKRFNDRLGREWRLSSTMLGSGTFGNVYLGLGQDGTLVAVKCIPISLKSKDECRNVVKEIRLLLRLKSERMVQYIASTVISNYLVIVMEAVGGGSLMGTVQQYPSLPTAMIVTYLKDILVGLRYLHSHGVVHRDIKPHNILMTQMGRCKLADFGAACHVGFATASEKSGDIAGTIVYMAPESCAGELHVRSDLWSLGIMAYQMATKSLPYHPADLNLPHAILHKLSKRDPAVFRPDISAAPTWIRGFISRCLEFDPDLRPAADDLVRHSALAQQPLQPATTHGTPQLASQQQGGARRA